jgi:hypothetical protein
VEPHPQFWTAEKWIRVTDDERNIKFVGLNQPLTLGEQLLEEFKKQPNVTPEQIAQAEQQAKMDPRMQQVVGVKNKVAELDVDIVLDEVPASATLQTEQFEQLSAMAQAGVPIPPDVIIEASSLRNKEKILKKMRGEEEGALPPQVQQQMQAMQQGMEEAQGVIQQLQEQLAQAKAQAMEAKAAGPAAELERQELVIDYEGKLLQAMRDIALLRIELKTLQSTNKMNEAASRLEGAAQEIQQPTDVPEVQ